MEADLRKQQLRFPESVRATTDGTGCSKPAAAVREFSSRCTAPIASPKELHCSHTHRAQPVSGARAQAVEGHRVRATERTIAVEQARPWPLFRPRLPTIDFASKKASTLQPQIAQPVLR